MIARSWDVELALKEEDGSTGAVLSLNSDVVLEGGSEAWHIEAEVGLPLLTDGTGGLGAVSVVVGSTCAIVGVGVGDGTSEFALEGDGRQVDVGDVPDSTDIEFLRAGSADGVGITGGVLGKENEFVLS